MTMKEKIKKLSKSKIFLLILGIIIGSTTSVYAVTYFPSNQVTYNNSSSKLNSTNVQGAIDELYNTCKTASSGSNNFKSLVLSDSDNLYFSTNDGIYSMNSNGAGVGKISNYVANALVLADYGDLYFSTNDGIYSMNQNGQGVSKIY